MISLMWGTKNGQIHRQKVEVWLPEARGLGEWGIVTINGHRISVLHCEDCSIDWWYNNVNIVNTTELYI